MQKGSTTAIDTLAAAFCHKSEMMSKDSVNEFLAKHYKQDGGHRTVKTFMMWRAEMFSGRQAGQNAHVRAFEADSTDGLHDHLKQWTSLNPGPGKPAFWPWVHLVKLTVKDVRILRHVTLIDLPGIDDTNQVRVKTAYNTLRTCDAIPVVVRIGRVATDAAVDGLLRRYGRTHEVAVVCTAIDQVVNEELAK